MFRRLSAAKVATLIAAAVLTASLVAPAGGVVSHGPSLKSQVSKALKLAKAADSRSRRALKLAKRPRLPGPTGPQGAPGTNGTGSAVAGVTAVDFRANPGESRVILNQGGLVLTAGCAAGPNVDVRATTTVEHSIMHVMVAVAAAPAPTSLTDPVFFAQKNDFLTTSASQTLTGINRPDGMPGATGGHLSGSLTFSTPTGTITTLTYGAEQGAFGGAAAKGCWFGGTAVTAG